MKAVIIVLAALLAVAGKAHGACSKVPQYTEKIDPVVCPRPSFKLPNYENSTTYYQCNQNSVPVLTSCGPDTYFTYVLQQCSSCADYFPSAQCNSLPIDVQCVPNTATPGQTTTVAPTTISPTTTAPGQTTTGAPTTVSPTTTAPGQTTTVAPTTVSPTTTAPGQTTTVAPTTVSPTTTAPGQSTTVTVPTPPTDAPSSTTTGSGGDDDIITPTGTTIAVPEPPSPNDGNVPTPVTPAPTAPVINDSPPTAPSPVIT